MAINFAEKYSSKVDERFTLASLTQSAFNQNYDWEGVNLGVGKLLFQGVTGIGSTFTMDPSWSEYSILMISLANYAVVCFCSLANTAEGQYWSGGGVANGGGGNPAVATVMVSRVEGDTFTVNIAQFVPLPIGGVVGAANGSPIYMVVGVM